MNSFRRLSGSGLLRAFVERRSTPRYAKAAPVPPVQCVFERLEPRILLSADLLGGIAANDLLQGDQHADLTSFDANQNLEQLIAPFLVSHDRQSYDATAMPVAIDLADFSSLLESASEDNASSSDVDAFAESLKSLLPELGSDDAARQEIIFVDAATPDYEQLIDGIATDAADTQYLVFVLDSERDGVAQIGEVLANYSGIDAIHLVSHGSDGEVQLGNGVLNSANLNQYQNLIQGWSTALDSEADFLIYGCNLAASEAGQGLLQSLANLTGADIAASDDLTGSNLLGGDWELEYNLGQIEAQVAFSQAVQSQWQGTLDKTFTVNTVDDTIDINVGDGLAIDTFGNTSLRAAIMEANALLGHDTINLGAGAYKLTLLGTPEDTSASGDLDIRDGLTIIGAGAGQTFIDGDGKSRVMQIIGDTAFNVSISNLTIEKGDARTVAENSGAGLHIGSLPFAPVVSLHNVWFFDNRTGGGGDSGGAIFNGGDLTITNSLIEKGSAEFGGGIMNEVGGTLSMTNVTLSDNTATGGDGGGLFNAGTATLLNVTVANNQATGAGGGIHSDVPSGASTTINNTIVANNTASSNLDIDGAFVSNIGDNLVENVGTASGLHASDITGVDPLLGNLEANGGTTKTHALTVGSAAIGNASPGLAPLDDQRGYTRDTAADIGAYEFNGVNADPTLDNAIPDQYTIFGTAFSFTFDANTFGDTDAGDVLTYRASLAGGGALPAWLNFDASTRTFSGTASNTDFGQWNIVVTADDGSGGLVASDAFAIVVDNAEFVVNSTDDTIDINLGDGLAIDAAGNTSLRAAIMESNALAGSDTIILGAATYLLDLPGISAEGGDLDVFTEISIEGAGAGLSIIDGGGIDRVFDIFSGSGNLALFDLTVQGGDAGTGFGGGIFINNPNAVLSMNRVDVTGNQAAEGGGIYNKGNAYLTDVTIAGNNALVGAGAGGGFYNWESATFNNVTVSGNTATQGGGIYNDYIANLTNVTLSGNTATVSEGGGLYNAGGGGGANSNLLNVTVSNNNAQTQGGGIFNGGSATISNTIVANNTSVGGTGHDVFGTFASDGSNLIEDVGASAASFTGDAIGDPNLAALADNGGFTQTHALLSGSLAIDNGTSTEDFDQRGYARVGVADIGAYEAGSFGLVWVDQAAGKIQTADYAGNNVTDMLTGLTSPLSVAVDMQAGKVYWSDDVLNTIQRANFDGSGVETIISSVPGTISIDLDTVNGKIYWVEGSGGTLLRANLDGTGSESLIGSPSAPSGIAIDVANNKIYWADPGVDRIKQTSLDGIGTSNLISSGLGNSADIALDASAGHLYWSDDVSGTIKRVNVDGTNIVTLISGLSSPYGLAVDGSAGKIYWTDSTTGQLNSANLDGSNNQAIATGLSGARDVDVVMGAATAVASPNTAPVADAGGPYTINEGDSLVLNASGSSDIDPDTLSYTWDIDGDGQYDDASGINPTISWASLGAMSVPINDDGPYTIMVRVDDGAGGVTTDSVSLTVNNVAPTLSTTGTGSTTAGLDYTLNLSAIDPGADIISSWTINWGDGSIETFAGNPTSVTHTYDNAGFTYNILASAVDEDGTHLQNELLVASGGNDSLLRFGPDAAFLQKFATADGSDYPVDIIVGPDGNLYVSGWNSDDVLRYNATTGVFIDTFIAAGTGGLDSAAGLAFGPDGNLYVASRLSGEVLRFDASNGNLLGAFVATATSGGLTQPEGLTFGPDGDLYVSDYDSGEVYKYDGTTGVFDSVFVKAADSGGLVTPEDLTFGPDGNLYVASDDGSSVLRYNGSTGASMGAFIASGSNGLANATGITFGPDGNLYVASWGTDSVLRFNGTTGAFIDVYISTGSGTLSNPDYMNFIPEHQVTVAASGAELWLSTNGAATDDSAASITSNEVASFGGPDLQLELGDGTSGSPTDGTFSHELALQENLRALHYVNVATTVDTVVGGTAGTYNLQPGQIVLSMRADDKNDYTLDKIGGGTISANNTDVLVYDPGLNAYDFLLEDAIFKDDGSTPANIHAISIVEKNITIGVDTTLTAGTYLIARSDPAVHADISTYNAAQGRLDLLLGVNFLSDPVEQIQGIELIETATTVGGVTLSQGTLLISVTTNNNDPKDGTTDDPITVGTAGGSTVAANQVDIVALTINATEQDIGAYAAANKVDAQILFDGSDIGFAVTDDSALPGEISGLTIVSNGAAPVNQAPTGSITISGSAQEDSVLTVNDSLADADGMGAVSYQWQRNGVDISGATGTTYTLDDIDVGKVITVEASYTDGAGKAEFVESAPTAPVAGINDAPTLSKPGAVFINEIHYDNTGVDFGEGIEIAGVAGTSLNGWSLVLYNGFDGSVYHTEALAGIIPNETAGFGAVAWVPGGSDQIQNGTAGNPDGFALVDNRGNVVQFLSYEGTFTALEGPAAGMLSTDIGVQESELSTAPLTSLQLTGTGTTFSWSPSSLDSFGALNTGQDVTALAIATHQNVLEDGTLVFSTANGNSIDIDDPDDGQDPLAEILVQLNANRGTLTLGDSSGLKTTAGAGTSSVTITGSVSAINNALEGLSYKVDQNYYGAAQLGIWVDDQGNTGAGGDLQTGGVVHILVSPQPDDPTLDNAISDQLATEANLFSFTFAANTFGEVDGDTLTYTAKLSNGDALPGWLTFNAGSRSFIGTPLNADVGSIDIEVTADDGQGGTPATDIFRITVGNINNDPTLDNSIPDQSATEDSAFNFIFDANTFSDVDLASSITYSATLANGDALPGWLTFTAADREFSGTPLNANVGTISIKVTADDGQGGTPATDTFDIVINNTNDLPTISGGPFDLGTTDDDVESLGVRVDAILAGFTTNDDDGDTLGIAITSVTGAGGWEFSTDSTDGRDGVWTSFGSLSTSSALLLSDSSWVRYVPVDATFETADINFKAWDGSKDSASTSGSAAKVDPGPVDSKAAYSSGTVVATVTVASVNTPAWTSDSINGVLEEDQTLSVAGNTINDPDGITSYSLQWQRDGIDIAGETGVTYTLGDDDVGKSMRVKVDFTDNDGNLETVYFNSTGTVANINDDPALDNAIANQSATEDSAFNFIFNANTFSDVDLAASITYSATLSNGDALPDWLTFTAADREFSGTPDNGDVGTISIKVTADDGQGGTPATDTFDIVIGPFNNAPTFAATATDPAFVEGNSAVKLFSGSSIDLIESGQKVKGLTFTVDGLQDGNSEILKVDGKAIKLVNGSSGTTVVNGLSYTVSIVGATATLDFTGGALTSSEAETLIDSVAYKNRSTLPGLADRVVSITAIQDDGGTDNSGSDTVNPNINSTVSVEAANELWLSTDGDVSSSGAPGQNAWADSSVLGFYPSVSGFEPATNGVFDAVFDIERFTSSNTNIDAIHYVATDIDIGSGTPVSLLAGDVLFSLASDETLAGNNSILANKSDVFVFRPDTPGNFTSGSFTLLFSNPNGDDITGITLVEEATQVGDASLQSGTFLFTQKDAGDADFAIHIFTPGDLSVSSTNGTVNVLVDGKEQITLGQDIFQDKPVGIELVENQYTIGGTTLQAGTILLTMDGDKGIWADNTQAGTRQDIYALSIDHTTLVNGSTAATASLLFEGNDVGLSADKESLDALSFTQSQSGDSDPMLKNAIPDQGASEDIAFGFTFAVDSFIDADGNDSLSYSALLADGSALPTWLNFDASTRTFSGTPLNADVGFIDVEVTADDGNVGTPPTDTFRITIANANDDPTLDNAIADQPATQDTAFSFTFNANTFGDVDAGASLTYTATLTGGGTLPGWLNFNAGARTFSGTPLNADVGTISIEVTADDGQGGTSATDTFDIVIANVNDDPTLDNAIADQSASEDTAFSFSFNANTFGDVDAGASLTYTATSSAGGALPSWLNFDAGTRTFSGTPLQADAGTLSIEVTADDSQGGAAATDTFNIVVSNSNDAPVGSVSLSSTSPGLGDTISSTVSLSDEDGLGALTYQWQRAGVDIAGATGSTYVVAASDVGSPITLVVSYTDGFGKLEKVTSNNMAIFIPPIVEPTPPAPEPEPEPEITEGGTPPESEAPGDPEPEILAPPVEPNVEEKTDDPVTVFESTVDEAARQINADIDESAQLDVEEQLDYTDKNFEIAEVSFNLVRMQNEYTPYNDPLTLVQFGGFVDAIDQMREEIIDAALDNAPVVGSTFAVSAGMSAGYVAWLARSGAVLGSVMSAMPMWRFIDPLPVLNKLDADGEDEESLEAIIENSEKSSAAAADAKAEAQAQASVSAGASSGISTDAKSSDHINNPGEQPDSTH